MKILITGGTGFLGAKIVDYLVRGNHDLIVLGRSKLISDDLIDRKKIKYCSYDISDSIKSSDNLYDFFGRPDVCIDAAWEGLPQYNSMHHFEKNLPAHYYFIKNLVFNGLKKVLVTGTCFEYGKQEGCLQESAATNPCTSYGVGKDMLRRQLEFLKDNIPFNLIWTRLFYLCGEGQRSHSLFAQLNKAIENEEKFFNMSKGEQIRDYLSVGKAANYISLLATQIDFNGIVNVCSGQPKSLRILVEDYVQQKGAKIELNLGYYDYPEYEPLSFWGSTKRLRELLNE